MGIIAIVALLFVFNETKPKSIRVALSWLNQAQFAGMYVASAKGFYKDEGVLVHLMERDLKGPSTIDLLDEKKVDVAIVSSGDFLRAADNGKDILALAAIFQTSPIVIASLEKNSIKSPKDLVGKKIGIAIVSEESKLPVHALLEGADIPKSAVTFLEVGHKQVDALLQGEVDAISIYRTNELYELEKKEVPYSLIFPERFGVDLYGDVIVVNKEYLFNHEKEIGGFLRATFKGWEFAERDPHEATRITLEVDNPKYHDVVRERYILENALKIIRLYPKQTMGQMIPQHWFYMHELFHRYGLIGDIELANFFIDAEQYRKLGFPEY